MKLESVFENSSNTAAIIVSIKINERGSRTALEDRIRPQTKEVVRFSE